MVYGSLVGAALFICHGILPTPNNIGGSQVLLHESRGSRFIRIQERFVIKFGINVSPIEARDMLYVAKYVTVPVPKVHAIYQCREKQRAVTYLVVQYLPGTSLLNLWDSLDDARKTPIARILRTYFDQLRQLHHPGYFGNIYGGPLLDNMFSATNGAHEVNTSFATEDELVNSIIRIYELETGERMVHKTRYHRHILPAILHGNGSPTFTHNNFQRKNVIVQPDGTLVIIDWEFVSWYPAYSEYATVVGTMIGTNTCVQPWTNIQTRLFGCQT